MTIQDAIKTIKYPDIINYLSNDPMDEQLHFRIKQWYRVTTAKHKLSDQVLHVVLLLAMRQKKGVIPSNNYLDKTLETMLKFKVKTSNDAVQFLIDRIDFEIERNQNKKTVKENYKDKAMAEKIKAVSRQIVKPI